MSVRDELMFDFAVNMPRIMICGNMAVIDNVKRIVLFSEEQIVVHNGSCYTSAAGRGIVIEELGEERMIIKGELEAVRFFQTL